MGSDPTPKWDASPVRSDCDDCGASFQAATIIVEGKETFRARFCDACVEKRNAPAKPIGWIPMKDEVPDEFRDFDIDRLPGKARERAVISPRAGRFLIVGATGRGKSYLTVALAHRAIEGQMRPFFVSDFDLRKTLKPTSDQVQLSKNARIMKRLHTSQWCVIDDIGHGRWSAPYAELLREVLSMRKGKGKSTFITTQFPASQWASRFGGECEPETMDAIVRRLDDYYAQWTL